MSSFEISTVQTPGHKRLLLLISALFGVLLITFLIFYVVPGDAAQLIAGPRATPEIIQRIREEYGMDKTPAHPVLHVHLPSSPGGFTRRPVGADIRAFFPTTFGLTTTAMLLAVLFGIPLGVISAVYRDRWPDHLSRVFSVIGVSMPHRRLAGPGGMPRCIWFSPRSPWPSRCWPVSSAWATPTGWGYWGRAAGGAWNTGAWRGERRFLAGTLSKALS